ncbi:MAG: response regulator transcription factor [Candidatus Melainabacteria bacterium]|nr:response regulator transcription factor [Candidatus Melainabacteria bacterium]
MRILLAEDDEFLADGIAMALRYSGHSVDHARTGPEADAATGGTVYDAIILDLGLPRIDGMEILQRMRERGNTSPVLIVTARDAIDDRVRGLDLGANDYLVKPFHLRELEARLRAMFRAKNWSNLNAVKCGALMFDAEDRSATIHGERLSLSPRELAALEIMMQRNGRVVSRAYLSEHLSEDDWEDDITSNAIDIIIHRLRKKIENSGAVIETHRGLGFSLRAND